MFADIMALNYSHRPVFPAHMAEDNLVLPMRIVNGYLIDGIPERNGEAFSRPHYVNREIDDYFEYGRDKTDRSGSPECTSKDVIDLLPSDPFGMNITSTVTAITGWLEDLEMDYGGFGRSNAGRTSKEDYDLFAGFNFIWNNAMGFQPFPGNVNFCQKSKIDTHGTRHVEERDLRDAFAHFSDVSNSNPVIKIAEEAEGSKCHYDGDERVPHEAFIFALGYLGLKDLLSVDSACSSLHYTVCTDPLLWRSIHINQPLNERITDDILIQLTSRAQGNLQCLCLVQCPRITDDGLRHVVESNPRLTKLCVPGCTRLSIEGVVNIVKDANSNRGAQGIKTLRIGGLYGLTDEHFQELKVLLGCNNHISNTNNKLHFHHRGKFYLLCDDDRALDVETCQKCQKPRLVYDCPTKVCQEKKHPTPVCRACTLCIPRCFGCGRCINDNEYEETFFLELLCSYCFEAMLNDQDKLDQEGDPSIGATSNGICHNG